MQDSTVMPQAPMSQPSSTPSSAPAPTQASMSPQAAVASQPSYPTPQAAAPAPQAPDPWQQAYQSLAGSLSGTPQYQPQAQPWQPTPSAPVYPAYSPSAAPSYPAATGMPTSQPQPIPAYSPASPTTWQQAPSVSAPQESGRDEYLGSVSDESIQVLQHFGPEAPALLNRYACTVEDALLSQAQQSTQALQQLEQLSQGFQQLETALGAALEDNQAYNLMTTDPDLLADYVNDFFGPEGPYPQELQEDRLAADVAAFGGNRMAGLGQQYASAGYQRPQMEMPAPGGQPIGPGDVFTQLDQVAPQDRWKLLATAPAEALRAKALISDQPVF